MIVGLIDEIIGFFGFKMMYNNVVIYMFVVY